LIVFVRYLLPMKQIHNEYLQISFRSTCIVRNHLSLNRGQDKFHHFLNRWLNQLQSYLVHFQRISNMKLISHQKFQFHQRYSKTIFLNGLLERINYRLIKLIQNELLHLFQQG
jgi:hypothetical protein